MIGALESLSGLIIGALTKLNSLDFLTLSKTQPPKILEAVKSLF